MLRRTIALLVVGALVATPAAAQQEETGRVMPYLTQVGDLDGDGLRDVVSHGYLPQPGGTGYHLHQPRQLVARSGADGATLWTVELVGDLSVQPIDLGGEAGVLVVRRDGWRLMRLGGDCWASLPLTGCLRQDVIAAVEPLHLHVYDAAGALVWERSWDDGAVAQAANGWPALFAGAALSHAGDPAVLAARDGSPDRLVVVQRPEGSVATGDQQAGRPTRLEFLDAASGDTLNTRNMPIAGELAWQAVPDIDGDGRDDLFVAGSGEAAAMSAAGGYLWRVYTDSSAAQVRSVGDVDGDGRVDLGLLGTRHSLYPRRHAVLLGTTGEVLADRELVPWVLGVGDIDGDGWDDVLFVTPATDGMTVEAVAGDGRTLYSRTVDLPGHGTTIYGNAAMGTGLDADDDGVGDVWLRTYDSSTRTVTGIGVLSGRTGDVRTVHNGGPVGGAIGSVQAATQVGGTLIEVQVASAGLQAVAHTLDGTAWVRDLGVPVPPNTDLSVGAERISDPFDPTGPDGILVNWQIAGQAGAALLGLDGTLRWKV